ncbi:ABC transporter substrate-binding protein [Parasulfitobacter algicola]|uniref:ABC transporter substrate-binding protein n=1 Tax=Parasulfitobacter algicola TaxID=2614809 RepID=A0ABX2IWF3_9RHOB|nr:ABC transporter substrate-binding protein [Sulfitobacter algicola]NSX56660.1 ABC transporter substrate-binding protein [Sulfitobacter algicola]
MSVYGLLSKILMVAALVSGAAFADAPKRVVSINLCTDQLALLLAEPRQLISVSRLSHDPISSAMVDQAIAIPSNRGTAEDIYLLKPDLVLAGTFSSPATLSMLDRLGVPVEQFAPAYSVADIAARMDQMGIALGRQVETQDQIDAFETQLESLRSQMQINPRAALYYANGYTLGEKTLAGEILAHAGFQNVAKEAGLTSGGTLPLEQLIMLQPDLVVTGTRYPATSRSEEILDHPALDAIRRANRKNLTDRDWICGTPFVLNAIQDMRDAHQEFGPSK